MALGEVGYPSSILNPAHSAALTDFKILGTVAMVAWGLLDLPWTLEAKDRFSWKPESNLCVLKSPCGHPAKTNLMLIDHARHFSFLQV